MIPTWNLSLSLFISDNGPHYNNTGVVLYLAEVTKAFQLTLVEYNNFEAGEGKSKLDTHFAQSQDRTMGQSG